MARTSTASSIDEYIAGFPPEIGKTLQELRSLVGEVAPEATETISYGMPTFNLNGRHLVHFAGWSGHVALYPAPGELNGFEEALKAYRSGKGTVRFPLGRPLPTELIRRIVEHWVDEATGEGPGSRVERRQ